MIGFIVALVAISLCYAVNPSTHTVQSWSCRWRSVPMMSQPYFGTLCKQNEVSTGLAVLLVPLEFIILGVAAYGVLLQKRVDGLVVARKGSPVPS